MRDMVPFLVSYHIVIQWVRSRNKDKGHPCVTLRLAGPLRFDASQVTDAIRCGRTNVNKDFLCPTLKDVKRKLSITVIYTSFIRSPLLKELERGRAIMLAIV